jgi:mannose-6-phosphate isomerase
VVAEIQQASDTTYRLFDWNRVGPDGRPRALHVEQAVDCIDYQRGPIQPQVPQPGRTAESQRLVHCDKFVLERRCLAGRVEFGSEDRLCLLAVLQGQVALAGDPAGRSLQRGEVALLPAACGVIAGEAAESTEVLEVCLP